jgi:predicted heme/steroid binding protein
MRGISRKCEKMGTDPQSWEESLLKGSAIFRLPVFILPILTILISHPSFGTVEYAIETGEKCAFCHLDPSGGGDLSPKGERYLLSLNRDGAVTGRTPVKHAIRFVAGFVHMLTAILWFGTILYVHLLLKPAYAARGLPRGELFVGWLSILFIALSGGVLTYLRVHSPEKLFQTKFGILLAMKFFLFLVMVSTAFLVTFVLGPRMKSRKMTLVEEGKHDLTMDELAQFDGKEGRKAYLCYSGNIYDVTASPMWDKGEHLGKHHAGFDLTDALKTAPHEEERVLQMPLVGKIVEPGVIREKPSYVKMFYFFAYLNLALVFTIVLIVAAMRWW